MKQIHDRVMQAKKTVALVSACSVSIEQAIHTALSSVGGTVFEAKLREVDLQIVWRVKLLSAGQRIKVYVDARSGRVLNAKAEISVDEYPRELLPDISGGNRASDLHSLTK